MNPTFIAVMADDPDALRGCLPPLVAHFGSIPGDSLLCITLSCCGATRVYEEAGDIPRENVGPCECGNWFIYYGRGLMR